MSTVCRSPTSRRRSCGGSDLDETWARARAGSRTALARRLSWVERGSASAAAVAALALPASGKAPMVGATGAPRVLDAVGSERLVGETVGVGRWS